MRLFVALLFASLSVFAMPRAEAGNPALEALLKAADLPYEVDDDGDYKLVVEWTKEKRTQLVFVSSEVEELGGLKLYTLMSPGRVLPDSGIDASLATRLLGENSKYKLGAWEVAGRNLYFTTKFPTTVSPDQLHTLVFTTAEIADDLEIELDQGKDDL